MKLTQADWLRILGIIVGIGGAVTPQVLEAMGIPTTLAAHVVAIVGFLVVAASIVSSKLANPSPPAGTNYAAIPQGSIPAARPATTAGGQQVAMVNPDTTTVQPLSQKVN